MKYFKLFPTHSQYEEYINHSDAILPNVSLCNLENEIHFNAGAREHDYVEIAGLKWATMNIGATAVTDYGKYFQWGDISGYTASQIGSGAEQKYFGWVDYKYNDGTASPTAENMTKYNSTDGLTTLQLSDDGVRSAWGGVWRMPTRAEFVALGNATTTAWTADYMGSGVAGMIVTDKTDSSKVLFFPACGFINDGNRSNVGASSYYWCCTLLGSSSIYAYSLIFNSSSVNWQNANAARRYGFCLRGVVSE